MRKFLSSNTYLQTLIVFATAVLAFFPTTKMFFYLDEWGALYDFTHTPYRFYLFTTNNYYLLYKMFGVNATGYFVVGTLIYALSVVLFYFLVSNLLKNKMLGLVAGLLYATTPVGISTATMIWTYVAEGGYPLTIMLLVLLSAYLLYFRKKKISYFVLVALGFLFFLELEPRRVFMFLPILFLFDYVVGFKRLIPSIGFFIRQGILLGSFIFYYRYDVTLSKILTTGKIVLADTSSLDGGAKLEFGLKSLTHIKPLVTLTNMLLGGPWVLLTDRLTGYVDFNDVEQVFWVVVITLFVALGLVVLSWRVKREWGLLSLFSLGWMHINVLGIYIFSSPGISDTTHRTLSPAAPAYALFYAISGISLYTFLKKKKIISIRSLNRLTLVALLVVVGTNFAVTNYTFERFNEFHSYPARAFFKDIKEFYPTLSPNPLLYIESSRIPKIKYQLSRIYGGNPYGNGSSITAFYPEIKKEEIAVVSNLAEVEKFIGEDPAKINHVFAFYYDEHGLQNKTDIIRAELSANISKAPAP